MSTFPTGRDALNALAAFLNTQLSTTHVASFSQYPDGARCIASDDTTSNPGDMVKAPVGPYAVLRVDSDRHRDMGLVATVYDCAVRVEVKANEITGGKTVGLSKGDSTLLRVLHQIISDNTSALKGLGFGAIDCEAQTERTQAVRGARQENNKPFRVTFYYLRPARG